MNISIDEEYIETYSDGFRISFYIDLISSLFALYVIIKHSTNDMGLYKIFLIDISICSMLLDIHTTLFYIPIPLFPMPGFCTGGLMKGSGLIWGSRIPFELYLFLFGICGASMICAFTFRYAAVTSNDDWFYKKKIWVAMGLFHILLASPSIFTHMIAMAGTEKVMMEHVESKFPSYLNLFKTHTCCTLMIGKEHPWTIVTIVMMIFNIIFSYAIALRFIIATLKHLKSMRSIMSESTYKKQKQFIFALILQAAVPTFSLVVPLFGLAFILILQIDDMKYMNWIGFEVTSLHSFFNTLMLCFTIPIYRKVILKPFFLIKKKFGTIICESICSRSGATTIHVTPNNNILIVSSQHSTM